jgi:hypothetical protein
MPLTNIVDKESRVVFIPFDENFDRNNSFTFKEMYGMFQGYTFILDLTKTLIIDHSALLALSYLAEHTGPRIINIITGASGDVLTFLETNEVDKYFEIQ